MSKVKRSADTLVKRVPSVFSRRQAIIVALCQGGVGIISHYNSRPGAYADFIVQTASRIIEATEN